MHETTTGARSFILCELAGAIYGVPSDVVRHIELVERITPLPNAPAAVEGVVFSRGQVIPALSLRQRFGFGAIAHDIRSRLVVIHSAGRTVGLIVDTAREFVSIPADLILPAPETIERLSGDYLEGIASLGERLILILRVDNLLTTIDLLDPADAAH